jgi:hypothetical protein
MKSPDWSMRIIPAIPTTPTTTASATTIAKLISSFDLTFMFFIFIYFSFCYTYIANYNKAPQKTKVPAVGTSVFIFTGHQAFLFSKPHQYCWTRQAFYKLIPSATLRY